MQPLIKTKTRKRSGFNGREQITDINFEPQKTVISQDQILHMNYLAHAFLSNSDSELLTGNFIADHLRGNNFSSYPPRIVEGILMHRKIDTFTDVHPEFKKSKRFFYDGFEKYSGVLVDIYFDHLLARSFSDYSSVPLPEFAQNAYKIYTDQQKLLPEGSQRFLDYVIKNNVYHAYASTDGIKTVLFHLSHRIKHKVRLDDSLPLFRAHEKELNDSFSLFFNDAMKHFMPDLLP